jgi:hypothetical protein
MRLMQGLPVAVSLRQLSTTIECKPNKGKTMKQLKFPLATIVLALVLSVPAVAGDMQCGVTAEPPSPPPASVMGDMQAGATLTGETTNSEATAVDPVTETMLQLMLSVLSLF